MKKILSLVIVMVLIVGCQKSTSDDGYSKDEVNVTKEASTLDKEVLRVGMELQFPPFETKNTDGEPEGASVMLAEALGKFLGKEIVIVDTPYSSLIPALQTGSVDLIISSMTINEERQQVVDFSIPYTTSELMMLAHIDSKVNSAADLNDPDVIIACKTGTIGSLWAAANAPEAKVINLEDEASAVLEVAQGKADVYIYDPLSIIRHQQNYPDTTKTILEALPNTSGWGIALKKGDTQFKEKLDEFINLAKTDGTYDKIRETYLEDDMKEFEQYGLEFFF